MTTVSHKCANTFSFCLMVFVFFVVVREPKESGRYGKRKSERNNEANCEVKCEWRRVGGGERKRPGSEWLGRRT